MDAKILAENKKAAKRDSRVRHAAYNRAYYGIHREHILERKRAYYLENSARIRAATSAYKREYAEARPCS